MSAYDPRRQGRRDGRDGKPPYQHKSAWNQAAYDTGYAQGERERQAYERETLARVLSDEDINTELRVLVGEMTPYMEQSRDGYAQSLGIRARILLEETEQGKTK